MRHGAFVKTFEALSFRLPFAIDTDVHRVACLLICVLVSLVSQTSEGAPGDLDTTFNGTGKVTTSMADLSDHGYGLAVQADGKIVVAGSAALSDRASSSDFALVRYNADGSLDTNFNASGRVITAVTAEIGRAHV